eukprot:4720415-Prymnesium_polylepis.1
MSAATLLRERHIAARRCWHAQSLSPPHVTDTPISPRAGSRGLDAGDRCAFLASNSAGYVALSFGAMALGAAS